MKEPDELTVAPPAGDESCVSGLVGNVLNLIISILVWLQKAGCKGGSSVECPETCGLNAALQQLTVIAQNAEDILPAPSEGKRKKSLKGDDSKKNLKKSKSGENPFSILYALDKKDNADPSSRKICKKFIDPRENKENKDNVIFEVVEAQMVEADTQTNSPILVDSSTEPEEVFQEEKNIFTVVSYTDTTTQVSKPNLNEELYKLKVDTEDKSVQVEIILDKDTKDALCECEMSGTNVRFRDPDSADNRSAEQEYEDEDDEEDYDDNDPDWICPDECMPFLQPRQPPGYRQPMRYCQGQSPIRQEVPQYYSGYQVAPPMYKQYNTRYCPRDAYGSARYSYPPPPQPYYQKVTRTIHRGSTVRTSDYPTPSPPQRQMSPTQRPLTQDAPVNASYPELQDNRSPIVSPKPTPSPVVGPVSARVPKNETLTQREPVTSPKECVPNCPGNKGNVRKLSATVAPTSAPQQQKPASPAPAPEKDEAPPKKCIAKCAKNSVNQQKQQSPSKDKPRPVALMPKGAIPVEPRDILQVEEAPKQPQVVPDSVMSVEASNRKNSKNIYD